MDWAHEFIKYASPLVVILWASVCRYRRCQQEAQDWRIAKDCLPSKKEKK